MGGPNDSRIMVIGLAAGVGIVSNSKQVLVRALGTHLNEPQTTNTRGVLSGSCCVVSRPEGKW